MTGAQRAAIKKRLPQSRKDRKGAQGEEREIGDWLLGKRDR
jgi:hypothetical protein